LAPSCARWRRPNRSKNGRRRALIQIGAKIVSHGRYVALQKLAQVASWLQMFREVPRLIRAVAADGREPSGGIPIIALVIDYCTKGNM
jgi:hypothetical protein